MGGGGCYSGVLVMRWCQGLFAGLEICDLGLFNKLEISGGPLLGRKILA